ncbi:MAG: glycine cleavage system aminomethyltransferase GcvT [Candidatus Omnitrophica bacterium]|nr:glycine cleavage system aminomethyltransferase GcvT [Candidatus Omnitrophota bacterium]
MNLKTTPLHSQSEKLGAKFAPFGGWDMPISYSGIIDEHNWTRKSACLFDICHMGEFIISGAGAGDALNKIVTMNIEEIPVKACRYGFMLNENGGIIDDLIVYKIDNNKFMMVVNAATKDIDLTNLKKHLPEDISLEDISDKTAKIDLQGPLSRDILKEIISADIEKLTYYTFSYFDVLGENSIVSRTGYTGELGYEIYISAGKAVELWDTLLKDKRVKPGGLGARDTLRLEMSYPLYGHELDNSTSPLEAGLGIFVDLDKEFIGKDVLVKQKEEGLLKRLVCFKVDSRRAPRNGYKILSGDKEIGVVSSGSFSPSLKRGIGMGYVEADYRTAGTKVTLGDGRVKIKAEIIKRPFYKEGSLRK